MATNKDKKSLVKSIINLCRIVFKNKKSPIKSIINLRRIVLIFSIGLIVLAFFLIGSIRKQKTYEKQGAEFVARMQEQVASLTEANARMAFELEQLNKASRIGDTIASIGIWQRKIDSLERLNYYNSVMNQIVALNESTLTKAREDNQRLYDDYLTHVNSIVEFFSVLIALVSIVIPLMINRKTDDIIKEHEERIKEFENDQNDLKNQITIIANKAQESANQTLTVSEIASNNNIAMSYVVKGEYDKALDYYKIAITMCESKLGKNHLYTATTYNNIGEVYFYKGDYNKALSYFGKSLAIRETKLDSDHPDTATTYNNIAGVYFYKKEYDKALEYFGKALEICEKELGKDNPDTATTYDNIASVYGAKKDPKKALEYTRKAMEIRETKLGTNHPDTAISYNNIAGIYDDMGDDNKSFEYYEKALKTWLNKDPNHPDAILYFKNFRNCYNAANKETPFEQWLKKRLNEKEWEAYLKLKKNLE